MFMLTARVSFSQRHAVHWKQVQGMKKCIPSGTLRARFHDVKVAPSDLSLLVPQSYGRAEAAVNYLIRPTGDIDMENPSSILRQGNFVTTKHQLLEER